MSKNPNVHAEIKRFWCGQHYYVFFNGGPSDKLGATLPDKIINKSRKCHNYKLARAYALRYAYAKNISSNQ